LKQLPFAGPRPAPLRLFPHLVFSHAAPVIVVTLALGWTLATLIQISMILTTLSDSELVVLRDEGTLHRSIWALDVAMRRGESACGAGARSASVAPWIMDQAEALRAQVPPAAAGPLKGLANDYLLTATEILSGDACTGLLGERLKARRGALDEQLTDVWVLRLDELHEAVTREDEEARNIAVSAIWVGIPLAGAALLLALLIARRMASIINRPLGTLAAMARRVGAGDFSATVRVEGPAEVVALAEALERMRVQLQQIAVLKESFLASVSHELRTPLSKIREALALLEDGAVGTFDPRQARVIGIARAACQSEIRMITTLLDVTRLRAGSPIDLKEGASIDRVLQSAIRSEESDASRRGVRVELRSLGVPPVCLLDPVLMERAVANLIRNAVAVSQSGQSVTVERSVVADPPGRPGAWIRIAVTDAGPGVPSEIRETLFEPFVTRPVPNSGKSVGLGLGLALVRELASAHHGALELVPHDGQGTTFQIWLPDRTPDPERLSEVQVPVESGVSSVA
jgi:two-component system, NtrC family, sensor histidine kinase GlrK